MEEFFFTKPLSSHQDLCIGPITKDEADLIAEYDIHSINGLFLYIISNFKKQREIKILAKFASEEEASEYAEILLSDQTETIAA